MTVSLSQQLNRRFRPGSFAVTRTVLFFLAICTLIPACTSPDIYMDDRYNPPVYWGQHVVREGDTLYGIAWRYGRDVRELADANHLPAPYVIRPGQVIRLDLKGSPGASSRTVARVTDTTPSIPAPAVKSSAPSSRSSTASNSS